MSHSTFYLSTLTKRTHTCTLDQPSQELWSCSITGVRFPCQDTHSESRLFEWTTPHSAQLLLHFVPDRVYVCSCAEAGRGSNTRGRKQQVIHVCYRFSFTFTVKHENNILTQVTIVIQNNAVIEKNNYK